MAQRKEKPSWGIWRMADSEGAKLWLFDVGGLRDTCWDPPWDISLTVSSKHPQGPANHNIISDITTQIQGSLGSL